MMVSLQHANVGSAPSPRRNPSAMMNDMKDAVAKQVAASSSTPTQPQSEENFNFTPRSNNSEETVAKERIDIINDFLQDRVTTHPLIGVICGSGLGGLSNCLSNQEVIKYEDIPQFPRSTVEGHAGELVFGDLNGIHVVCMRGRFHCYEGYSMQEVTLPVRAMYLLGIKYLLVTNAAGGLNPDYSVGDLMILNDHLNMPGLSGQHPLIGPNDARFGGRFIPLSNCYDEKLQDLAFGVAEKLGLAHKVQRGVYCFVSGPTYETPTEAHFLRLVGCDAVGMSTAPEAIVAAHCGLKTIGLSIITNKALFPGEKGTAACHEEVIETILATQQDIETFVRDLIIAVGTQHQS